MDVDLDDEGGRYKAREVLGATIKPWVLARTLAEVRETFDLHGVSWGPYQTFKQLVESDRRCSAENPMFAEVEQPGVGTYLMPGTPLAFSGAEHLPPRPAPELGQHTDEVLADVLGLADHEIGRLHDAGVVAGPGAPRPASPPGAATAGPAGAPPPVPSVQPARAGLLWRL